MGGHPWAMVAHAPRHPAVLPVILLCSSLPCHDPHHPTELPTTLLQSPLSHHAPHHPSLLPAIPPCSPLEAATSSLQPWDTMAPIPRALGVPVQWGRLLPRTERGQVPGRT